MTEGDDTDGDDDDGDKVRLIHGDSFDELDDLPADSVHAVVTDPPYNYEGGFMGEEWDDIGSPREFQRFTEAWARKAKRVLKPGGHLLAFGSSQSYHRVAAGVEDAGYTVRDTLTWHYGNGFPKGQNIGNADAAAEWDGWNTQLKPATEFVVLARSPLSEGTVAENVLEHGTGALNIDGCRLTPGKGGTRDGESSALKRYSDEGGTNIAARPGPRGGSSDGRFPANLLLDEQTAEDLDEQAGDRPAGRYPGDDRGADDSALYGNGRTGGSSRSIDLGTGGPSRYFYTSKASRSERTHGGRVENDHPTVKPVDLMKWLVRLVTAEGQTVLDPFLGSGTTAVACLNEYRRCIGIEADADSVETARDRVRDTRERNPTEEGERLTDYATDGGDTSET